MRDDTNFYIERIEAKRVELENLKKKFNLVSILRLIDCLVFIVFIANYFFGNAYKLVSILFMCVTLVLFFMLLKWHSSLDDSKKRLERGIEINKEDLQRKSGGWRKFSDDGLEYLDIEHPFINDLDVFGKNSFFQWVNVTKTIYGRKKFIKLLRQENKLSKNEIYRRQKAILELSKKQSFRERFFIALPYEKQNTSKHNILDWVHKKNESILSVGVRVIKYVGPIITIVGFILAFLGFMSWFAILIILFINYIVLSTMNKEVDNGIEVFMELKNRMLGYVEALELLEIETFSTDILLELQNEVKNKGLDASGEFKRLYTMGSWLNDRQNAFYIIFNLVFYWDYHILSRVEKWKLNNSDKVEKWIDIIATVEVLESLSIASSEELCMPIINDELKLCAVDIIHPMLNEKGVSNSFKLDDDNRVALITGSNMSGKSTFLRTIGFSMFLAYLGLPVKASRFSLPIVNLYTCMRTGDNLNDSVSSFYAEILRVKSIVVAAEKNERFMFLLDEIFKGTNSLDRHEGAKVLIEQLLKGQSLGLVSTHDLELCDMEKEVPSIKNYNFREYYNEDKIMFDYKLREGVSKTRNARYLMRLAGIKVED